MDLADLHRIAGKPVPEPHMRIATLYERERPAGRLGCELIRLYDGDFCFPAPPPERPHVIANFVQTIDGVVSFRIPGRSGGGEISGGSAEDRFVMGLLRSIADAVLVGSGTLHGDPGHVRTPEFIYPEAKTSTLTCAVETASRRCPST
jgi:hypothetical protein